MNDSIETSLILPDESLSHLEQAYDLLRRNEDQDKIIEYLNSKNLLSQSNSNELLKNGDSLLCLSCNKGLDKIVKLLVESKSADVNLPRNINLNSSSSIAPTITISARRQSRLFNSSQKVPKGDSPLSICIKYGFDQIAEYLIEKGADICGADSSTSSQPLTNSQNSLILTDFEKSPLQDAIRLNRTKIVEKIFEQIFEKDDLKSIEWVFSKRYDILRQVLMTENLDTLKIILPNIIENRRIDGEMLIHILNYLLMKSKINDKKEKLEKILDTVMEIGTFDGDTKEKFEIYNIDIFIRGFLATLKALFNNIGDDSRTSILTYRTSLFFFVLKYQKSMINFEDYYADIDSAFDFFYSKMKETGENILKLVEYFINFYDTLITMDHLHLTAANVKNLLKLEHVKKLDILGDFLIQRSLIPLDLKELTRIKVKDLMHTYNLFYINDLPLLDQNCKDYLYFLSG